LEKHSVFLVKRLISKGFSEKFVCSSRKRYKPINCKRDMVCYWQVMQISLLLALSLLLNIVFHWLVYGNKLHFVFFNLKKHVMKKSNTHFISFALLILITGCATTTDKPVEKNAVATNSETGSFINQYPTRDRVDYVLSCVAKHGGLNYVNQYACGCKIDKIAEKLTFSEYEEAVTFGFMGKTAGEAGSAFRDPQQAKALKKRIKEAEDVAESSCFVK
jgi:hypothetical protein